MLTVRKDAGSANKRVLYWNGRALNPVDHAKYWEMESKRIMMEASKDKAAHEYALAVAQQKTDNAILDCDLLKTMLDLRELQLKKALRKTS